MRSLNIAAFATIALALGGCRVDSPPTALSKDVRSMRLASMDKTNRHIVVFAAQHVPIDFASRVASLGGFVEATHDSIGVATVGGLSPAAAAELFASDVRALETDEVIRARDEPIEAGGFVDDPVNGDVLADATSTSPLAVIPSPTTAKFYARQWNMRAVMAHDAWAAGQLGSRDVKVAILDSGIDYLHPDLVGLVDLERSKSFVPEENTAIETRFPGRLPISDLRWHGTAAASIVASNAKVVAGVNLYVTLIAVKIADSTFATSVGRMISGIVYAADQGADVINLSNGIQVDKSVNPGIVAAFDRAVNYAFRKGALLVTVPFNDAADLDHNGDFVRMPCEAAHAICTSATGPTGADAASGPWYDVDALAPYSAYGRSAVDLAAPGGVSARFRFVTLPCTSTWTQSTGPVGCRTNNVPLELRLATGVGTSWSAPHVAGLAALLVAKLGHGNPALIRERILQAADDLGQPGLDAYYGRGRLNIARAMGLNP